MKLSQFDRHFKKYIVKVKAVSSEKRKQAPKEFNPLLPELYTLENDSQERINFWKTHQDVGGL